MANPYVTGAGNNGAAMLCERWNAGIEDTVYDLATFWPTIRELQRPYNKLHVRKKSRFSATTLAAGTSTMRAANLTYNANTEVEVTLVPAGIYVATDWTADFEAQTDLAVNSEFRQNCEDALTEAIDAAFLANAISITTNKVGDYAADVGAAELRNAIGLVGVSGRSKAIPGEAMIHACFTPAQRPALLSIPEVSHADIIGDNQSVLRSAILVKAMGLTLHFTNQVDTTQGGATNPVYKTEAFAYGFNVRPTAKYQDQDGLQPRVIVYANVGSNLVHDVRTCMIRSKSVITV